MSTRTAILVSIACSAATGILTGWMLLRWLGFGWLFLLLVLPVCMTAMHAVGGTAIRILVGVRPRK